jgi:hypothetical protein
MGNCESDLEIAAIHRNARTARHIVTEYVERDPSSIGDAKKHFEEILKQLGLQLSRIKEACLPASGEHSALYAPFRGDPIEGMKMYGKMNSQFEEKGKTELGNAAKIRVLECVYSMIYRRVAENGKD